MYKVTAPDVWNIRSEHTVSAEIVRQLKKGDRVTGDMHWQDDPHPKELWLHLIAVNDEGLPAITVNGEAVLPYWMAIIHKGKLVYELPEWLHIVKAGDTLSRISGKDSYGQEAIIQANREQYPTIGTGNNQFIDVGWALILPGHLHM
jgi:hypothetical protein